MNRSPSTLAKRKVSRSCLERRRPIRRARPPADAAEAAKLSAARWQAVARFYEKHGLLNDEKLDSGELSAYRWNAMARAYERMGLLNK